LKIAVIGQGYVGLTVSYEAAQVGHEVIGYDNNKLVVESLSVGDTHIPGIDRDNLRELIRKKIYLPTSDTDLIKLAEIIIIAVPTPLTEDGEPNLEFLESASTLINQNIGKNVLVINESTSYPGTLRNIIRPKIINGTNTSFAAAPERVDPGNKLWKIKNTPRVISGLTEAATVKAKEFYSTICDSVSTVSCPEVAEAAKVFENTFRQVNIALVNEFSLIAHKLGFSANEAIDAASTKPFGFMSFYPSIGVGGHCIPVDPVFLSYIAKKYGIKSDLIDMANKLNAMMPASIINLITEELGFELQNKIIQIAGLTYKPDITDMREAPSMKLINQLRKLGANVIWHDPLLKEFSGEFSKDLDPSVDLGIIITPHKSMNFSIWKECGTKVLDLSTTRESFGWPKYL
jgi:UDP-N-acetyl-D-glucosamine dehydrogenase